MEILTDIALSKNEVQFYKKFKNLSVNETPKPQGEGVIRISPFDDYFIFTLYDEISGIDSPIDLSNVGTIYIVFIGNNTEVRIPNYTKVQDIDMSTGEVLFRIDKDNSQKILALENRSFYISTMMIDPDGNSDESIIYTGTFLAFNEAAKATKIKELEDVQIEYSKQLALLQSQIDIVNTDISKKDSLIAEQVTVIDVLRISNQNLSNEIDVLSNKISSSVSIELLQQAKEAQKAEENVKLQRLNIQSIKKIQQADQSKAKKKAFFALAAAQLRSNITGVNTITSSDI
jgi:hypothetical protein